MKGSDRKKYIIGLVKTRYKMESLKSKYIQWSVKNNYIFESVVSKYRQSWWGGK